MQREVCATWASRPWIRIFQGPDTVLPLLEEHLDGPAGRIRFIGLSKSRSRLVVSSPCHFPLLEVLEEKSFTGIPLESPTAPSWKSPVALPLPRPVVHYQCCGSLLPLVEVFGGAHLLDKINMLLFLPFPIFYITCESIKGRPRLIVFP